MRPILFDKSATNFSTNGIGRLECISCHVVEERNGMFELEAVVPIIGEHTADVKMESIIGAIPHDGGTIQAFRVYKIGKPINGKFTVYARHISYLLSDIPTMPFSVSLSPSACANTLAGLKNNAIESCPFNFYTDVTTASSYKQSAPASIRERLGGVEGSVLDQFGGEYEWDNFDVHLWKQRGRLANVTGITLRYGKNIMDINQEEAISNTVTGIVPYWIDTEGNNLVTLPEKVVYSQNASNFAYHLTQVLDLSSNFQEKPTVSQLRTYANTYVNKSGFGVPNVSIKVSFVNLWETEEYKDIAPLERVQLCDEINVQFEKLGISTVAKVVKTDYDVLKGRYRSIEVGHIRSNLTQAVTDRDKEIDTAFLDQITRIGQQISDATAWLTSANGYVVAVKNTDGSWKELLFMDTNDPSTARNVLRINNNGIGISTNGINGPYSTAWTIDGRFGDAANKNYWNLLTGEFRLSAGAAIVDQNANYRGSYVPTNSNAPASSWSASDKPNHAGETFLDVGANKMYIYKASPLVMESDHPYNNSEDKYYKFVTPNTWADTYLTFDPQCETEGSNWDYLDFYVEDVYGGMWKCRIQGSNFAGKVLNIISSVAYRFYLHWHSDGSVQKWGWRFTASNSGSPTITPEWTEEALPSASWTQIDLSQGSTYEWVEATIDEYVSAKSDIDLTQEEIFNILTNNGQTQGLFLQNGKVYLNGEYFATNALTIGKNPTTGAEPYLRIFANDGTTQIGRWDKNGIEATAGKFGKLEIKKNASDVTYLRYINSVALIYTSQSWTGAIKANTGGMVKVNPYQEGWIGNGYVHILFNMNLRTSSSSARTDAQCRIDVLRFSGGVNQGIIKTVQLRYDGKDTSGSNGLSSGEEIVVIDEETGEVIADETSSSPGYFIELDGSYGSTDGDFYKIRYRLTQRSSSYVNSASISIDDNINGSGFMVKEKSDGRASASGRFAGEFRGSFGSFETLDLGVFKYGSNGWSDGLWKIKGDGTTYGEISESQFSLHNSEDFNNSSQGIMMQQGTLERRYNSNTYTPEWTSSDRRIKRDIEPLPVELSKDFIDGTEPKSFKYRNNTEKNYGMIAQEARELLDSLGETDSALEYSIGDTDIKDQRTIAYSQYIPHLINYVKDLRSEIENLKEEIAELRKK